jgi:trehalose 6-phosphate phosphatase
MVTRLAQERTLCAFDFDGTLAPIAAHPDKARMRKRTRDLLRRVATLYPCIVVSGRNRADVLEKLSGVHVAGVLGNHGAESGKTPEPRRDVERWKAALELELDSMPGTWIEKKAFSLAIHYRQSPHKAETRRRIFAAAGKLKNVRVFGGKQVVNVVGKLAPHKGDALAAERDRLQCNWVLYFGDDENDEDAFALVGNIVPVRIGRKQRTHARYYLRTQMEMNKLFELLVRLREEASSRREASSPLASLTTNHERPNPAPAE